MTREIANWFHENTGELFTIDETPFDRQDLRPLTDDSVDPVQQIIVDGERYYGVIDYAEHEGWYEYTRYDDAAGRVQIGVCAQCVQEAEHVADVARTLGDPTDVASEKLAQHYDADHTEAPDEVETGATLVSGTTINSNSVIHAGMDGAGSNVDADVVRGGVAREEGTFYPFEEKEDLVDNKFASPCSKPHGVGLDSGDCIWNADPDADSIYQLNQSGSTIKSFSSVDYVRGLGVDSNDCIWSADAAGASIEQTDQSGSTITSFNTASMTPEGVGVDSNGCIWNGDTTADSIYKHNQSGTISNGFSFGGATGIGFDSDDCVWSAQSNNDSIHKLNQSGSTIKKLSTPCIGLTGVGVDSNGCIWHADAGAKSIFKFAPGVKFT